MNFYIVTGRDVSNIFRTCAFFKQSLGMVSTVEKNGTRQLNQSDKFAFYFNSLYKTTLYGSGNIGDIKVYYDLYINDGSIAIYIEEDDVYDEFVYKYDKKLHEEKGIDKYLGYLLKESELEYERRKEEIKVKEEQKQKIKGDPNKVFTNPGNVTYEDILAYKLSQNKDRF